MTLAGFSIKPAQLSRRLLCALSMATLFNKKNADEFTLRAGRREQERIGASNYRYASKKRMDGLRNTFGSVCDPNRWRDTAREL